jgi:hypothetical protein
MMLEWGWDKFINNKGNIQETGNTIIEEKWFTSNGTTQLEMLGYIQDMRDTYQGNYDGFFGKVSNFTWNFNTDGSYDISIDLITLGDVIESLKVNTFTKAQTIGSRIGEEIVLKTDKTLKGTNILKAATLNSIGRYLYLKIEEISKSGITLTSDMRVLEDPTDRAYLYAMISPLPDSSVGNQYYVKLGEFLARLETLIVPQIQNGSNPSQSQITISNTLEGNIISYFPNQVSLDPNVCIFRPFLNTYGDITGITYPTILAQLDQYVGYTKNSEAFGLLMNLYINFDFISKLLLTNGGPDQELSLFKFMQDLCNGINSALGGVNKLETIIKDDYIVTIIDQTFSLKNPVTVELEVYGYSPKNQTSNFVKDIKFVSKITPQLASMVSIGATAAGSNTSEIDGTAFSKWSEGLVDRFTEKVLEPDGLSKLNSPPIVNETTLRKEYDNFPDAIDARERTLMRIFDTGRWARLKKSGALYLKRINNPYYSQINGNVMDFDKFFSSAIDEINKKRSQGEYLPGDILNLTNENYAVWLVSAFGGTLNDIKISYPIAANTIQVIPFSVPNPLLTHPRYLEYDNTFAQQGIGCYQNYLNTLNNSRYTTTNIPSSEIGFIPLSFDITLDGISGIKIYNKLNINNEFLPSNYPNSLNFIITKVNHSIANNSWDTSLSTISIPKTEPYKFNTSSTTSTQSNVNVEGSSIKGPQPDNGSPFLILDGRNGRNIITLDNLLLELDPKARPSFKKFFNILKDRYSGYKAIVNSVRRTWEESYNLKFTPNTNSFNPSNAAPGFSLHNYGLAIDINIETPASTTKRTLLKRNKTPWIEEGLDKVAIEADLRWGGNFTNYEDCVHFDFYYNLNTAYNQILTQSQNLDSTIKPPFTPFSNGLQKCQKIDKLIKEGKIKLV